MGIYIGSKEKVKWGSAFSLNYLNLLERDFFIIIIWT